jgi:hypothetical protein
VEVSERLFLSTSRLEPDVFGVRSDRSSLQSPSRVEEQMLKARRTL